MAHMRNMAFRHRRAARKMAAKFGPTVHDYEIVDPAHRPDLRGELAGAKVRMQNGKQVVTLSPQAAQFYLDSGSIQRIEQPRQKLEEETARTVQLSAQSDHARAGLYTKG